MSYAADCPICRGEGRRRNAALAQRESAALRAAEQDATEQTKERWRLVEALRDIAYWQGPGNNWSRVRACEALELDPMKRHPFDSCSHSCCDRRHDGHEHDAEPMACGPCRDIWRHQS